MTLWMSYMAFSSLKYSYAGKENTLEVNQCGSESENAFILANFRICDLRTGTPRKFADQSLQICGFAICGLTKKICEPTFVNKTGLMFSTSKNSGFSYLT
jgi:hypothetical protein